VIGAWHVDCLAGAHYLAVHPPCGAGFQPALCRQDACTTMWVVPISMEMCGRLVYGGGLSSAWQKANFMLDRLSSRSC
jgi:hypothetical protein